MLFNPGPVTLHCGGNTLLCYVLCPMPQKPGTSEFACWEQSAPSAVCMSDIFPLVLSGGSLPGLMQDSHTQTLISTLLGTQWRPHTANQSSHYVSLPSLLPSIYTSYSWSKGRLSSLAESLLHHTSEEKCICSPDTIIMGPLKGVGEPPLQTCH